MLDFSRVSAAASQIDCATQPIEACCQTWYDPKESTATLRGAGRNCVIVRGVDTPPAQPHRGGINIEGGAVWGNP